MQVDELNEEIQGYRELSGTKHTDKINRLIDDMSNELQRNTKQILYDQIIRIKTETQLLNAGQSVERQDSTAQTCPLLEKEDDSSTSLLNTSLIDKTDYAPPTKKKQRKSNS